MNQIENTKRAARRRACSHSLAAGQRRVPAAADMCQRPVPPAADMGQRRSARSEARAADALINEYARGVATARAPRQTAA
jgi:hypothetical protein